MSMLSKNFECSLRKRYRSHPASPKKRCANRWVKHAAVPARACHNRSRTTSGLKHIMLDGRLAFHPFARKMQKQSAL